jgi:tetratricopeptide (TPR) repeat protein
MARSFPAFAFFLAAAILVVVAAVPALAQPSAPNLPPPASGPRQGNELNEALQVLQARGIPAGIPEAVARLEVATRKNPELPSSHVLMYHLLASQFPDLARLQLDAAAKADPTNPEPYVILGDLALKDRRLPEAKILFNTASELLSKYKTTENRKRVLEHQTLSEIALLAEVGEDWKEAERVLRNLLKIKPDDLTAWQRLARSLFLQHNAKDAYQVLQEAKKLDRGNSRMLAPAAIMGQYFYQAPALYPDQDPKIWFDYAVKNAPHDVATRQAVATWALENGKIDVVKEQAAAILTNQSDAAQRTGHMLRGLAALWEKRWEDAEKDFDFVILRDVDKKDFRARNDMALALVEQADKKKKDLAKTYAEENHSHYMDSADALSTLIWVYFKCEEYASIPKTMDEYLRVTGNDPRDPDTLTYMAYVQHHREDDWRAKICLERALAIDPANGGAPQNPGRPFAMMKEANELYAKVKDAKNPQAVRPAGTP